MRPDPSLFEFKTPESLQDAYRHLSQGSGKWKILAGGTDLMVLFERGQKDSQALLNIWGLPELSGIQDESSHIEIGALCTYTDIRQDAMIKREFPNLVHAAQLTGGHAIQNRGTVGGNIANASPAADTVPALMAYDAEVILGSQKGERTVALARFYRGYKTMDLQSDELILGVKLPRVATPRFHYYRKVGTRNAQAISKVVLAITAQVSNRVVDSIRIALGSVAPTTTLVQNIEDAIRGRELTDSIIEGACRILGKTLTPIDDIRSTADYRLTVAQNILREGLQRLRDQP